MSVGTIAVRTISASLPCSSRSKATSPAISAANAGGPVNKQAAIKTDLSMVVFKPDPILTSNHKRVIAAPECGLKD